MKDIIYDESNGLEYTRVGNYYVPNLAMPVQEKIILNKYGRMRLKFLKEYKKADYTIMLINGTLNKHLNDIQKTAEKRLEIIINKLKAESNLTEEIKNTDVLFWVGTMNSIKEQAEEIIFRGILYKSIEKDNKKLAIIITSITFGIGHIVNLLNGADLIPTLMQICYATALGFLFVTILNKSKSLIPCIVSHIVINSLSIFEVENTKLSLIITSLILILISVSYTVFINKTIKE